MKKGILLVLVLGLMVFCATKDSNAQGGPPVLEKIWVSPEMNLGGMLKVYIKASDPDGDMRWLIVGAGRGKQVVAAVPIRLGKDMRKSINGYVYFDTKRAQRGGVATGTIEVQIEDWKGNESEAMSATIKIMPKDAKAQKPPADFQEVAIGPIMLDNVQMPGR